MENFVIVTPVYEDRASAERLFSELAVQYGPRIRLVVVDDGSVREPVEITLLNAHGLQGSVLTLAQNVGHQKAIAIGMAYACEYYPNAHVLTMDSDGEDMPASIAALLGAMTPAVDVVVAQRKSRVETLKFKIFYLLYKTIFKLLAGRKIDFGNFALYSPAAVARLSRMPTLWIHIAGTVLSSKLRIAFMPLDRGPRYAGQSKMNFVSLILHGFRSLMVFAEDVLVRVGLGCGLLAAVALAGVLLAVVLKLIGLSSPGWFSVIIGVFLLIMLQTGIMMLTMVLLTGVMKGVMHTPPEYKLFLKHVTHSAK